MAHRDLRTVCIVVHYIFPMLGMALLSFFNVKKMRWLASTTPRTTSAALRLANVTHPHRHHLLVLLPNIYTDSGGEVTGVSEVWRELGAFNSHILAKIIRDSLVKFLAFGFWGAGPQTSVWLAATVYTPLTCAMHASLKVTSRISTALAGVFLVK